MNGLLSSLVNQGANIPSASVSTTSIMTNNNNQTTSLIPEKDEIWSGILKTVASSKMVPTKNVLILGEPGVGKSTLVHYLKNDPGPQQLPKFENDEQEQEQQYNGSKNVTATNQYTHHTRRTTLDGQEQEKNDLALGYTFVDVKDEENEAMARLGLYQLGLSSPEFLPLLKFAIRSETISDSCVLILLDWTRPWKFIETLERWINVLHHLVDEICKEGTVSVGDSSTSSNWSKGKAVVDELKEKLEHYLQTYTEPSNLNITMTASTSSSSIQTTTTNSFSTTTPLNTTTSTTTTTNTSVDQQVVLPLTQGCLTNNLGIPITIVCCKSDALNSLEQTHDYKDDQFDFIQQTLRCICMKYGSALFYTSTLYPYTYHNLREYILHRTLSTSTKPYPFNLKAQVIERDTVLVPSGWDTWNKIKVLREGFDCDHVGEGWENDMDAVMDRQKPGNSGTRGYYEEAIPNVDELDNTIPQHLVPGNTTICEDEQSFFERHYETLQKTSSENHSRPGTGSAAHENRPGVVGPLGVSAATMEMMRVGATSNASAASAAIGSSTPSALDMIGGGGISSKKDLSLEKTLLKNGSTAPSINTTLPSLASSTTAHQAQNHHQTPTSPINNSNMAGAQNGPSHEVLANFFQSLLSKKASGGSGGAQSPTSATSPGASLLNGRSSNGGGSGGPGGGEDPTSYRRPAITRKDVHKELDRMRQYTASSAASSGK